MMLLLNVIFIPSSEAKNILFFICLNGKDQGSQKITCEVHQFSNNYVDLLFS